MDSIIEPITETDERTRDFILANFVTVAETKDFLNLSSKQVEEWISSDEIIVKGEDAIVACGGESTLCYIPSEDKWYKLADMLATINKSYPCQIISSCHGKLFRVGGNIDYPAEQYYPLLNAWFPVKSFQERIKYCAVVTFQGLLYVIGGMGEDNNRLSTVKRYNPDANLWQAMPSLSSPRSSVCAVCDGRHLYAIGGNSGERVVDIAERFDPKEKSWSKIASTVENRAGAGGAATDHKVFVFGGLRSEHYSNSSFGEMYDPVTDLWSIINANAVLTPIGKYISAVSFKGEIFVCGEFQQDNSSKCMFRVYNHVSSEWMSCTNIPLDHANFKISCLRIPREVLDMCEVLS